MESERTWKQVSVLLYRVMIGLVHQFLIPVAFSVLQPSRFLSLLSWPIQLVLIHVLVSFLVLVSRISYPSSIYYVLGLLYHYRKLFNSFTERIPSDFASKIIFPLEPLWYGLILVIVIPFIKEHLPKAII